MTIIIKHLWILVLLTSFLASCAINAPKRISSYKIIRPETSPWPASHDLESYPIQETKGGFWRPLKSIDVGLYKIQKIDLRSERASGVFFIVVSAEDSASSRFSYLDRKGDLWKTSCQEKLAHNIQLLFDFRKTHFENVHFRCQIKNSRTKEKWLLLLSGDNPLIARGTFSLKNGNKKFVVAPVTNDLYRVPVGFKFFDLQKKLAAQTKTSLPAILWLDESLTESPALLGASIALYLGRLTRYPASLP